MVKMLGYMLTWTTYGSWPQGGRKGYVKDGEVLGENPKLRKANIEGQCGNKLGAKYSFVLRPFGSLDHAQDKRAHRVFGMTGMFGRARSGRAR